MKSQEHAKNQSANAVCKTCGEARHARSSSRMYRLYKPSKLEEAKNFARTSVINTNLSNVCKSEDFVKNLQEAVLRVSQVVYAGAMFANHFC
ncbi:hypothetical protein BD560DRAFT_331005 [Blakeslea trispora]|nr:hypothetical protein BD560DRAFT_331005 [Blakeslea trispora]